MKQEETSILMIFQDPLINLVSVILLMTLFMVIPADNAEQTNQANIPRLQEEIGTLRDTVSSVDERINEVKNTIERLTAQLHSLSTMEKDALNKTEKLAGKAVELSQEVTRLGSIVAAKKEELGRLERQLRRTQESVDKDATVVNELDQKIRRSKEELAVKEASLKDLERQLEGANRELGKRMARQEEQKKIISEIQQELEKETDAVGTLRSKKGDLEDTLRNMPGFGEYSVVKNKKALVFDTIDKQIVEINDKNYDVRVVREMNNGQIVSFFKITKKNSAVGETANKIASPNSEFQRLLKKHSKEEYYLVFKVNKNAFALFHAARQIAWQQGFQVDWDPRDEGPIYGSTDGASREVRAR